MLCSFGGAQCFMGRRVDGAGGTAVVQDWTECNGTHYIGTDVLPRTHYLEDLHEQGAWSATAVAVNASRSSLVPAAPVDRAHMNLVIRTHDLYLASPNCTQPGPFTHVQGCFYVGVPGRGGTRWIERSVRAALLKECWEQLDNLEDLPGHI